MFPCACLEHPRAHAAPRVRCCIVDVLGAAWSPLATSCVWWREKRNSCAGGTRLRTPSLSQQPRRCRHHGDGSLAPRCPCACVHCGARAGGGRAGGALCVPAHLRPRVAMRLPQRLCGRPPRSLTTPPPHSLRGGGAPSVSRLAAIELPSGLLVLLWRNPGGSGLVPPLAVCGRQRVHGSPSARRYAGRRRAQRGGCESSYVHFTQLAVLNGMPRAATARRGRLGQ